MTYQEKKNGMFVIIGLTFLSIWLYMLATKSTGYNLKELSQQMLLFIGLGIAANILIMIVFHIIMAVTDKEFRTDPDGVAIEDEMDRLIELKSLRIGYILTGVGFAFSLVLAAIGKSPVLVLNIIFISFNIGSVLEGITKIYYYRRGVGNV